MFIFFKETEIIRLLMEHFKKETSFKTILKPMLKSKKRICLLQIEYHTFYSLLLQLNASQISNVQSTTEAWCQCCLSLYMRWSSNKFHGPGLLRDSLNKSILLVNIQNIGCKNCILLTLLNIFIVLRKKNILIITVRQKKIKIM